MIVRFFGAEHCPQCKVLRPQVEKWCKEHDTKFVYWDADSEDAVTARQLSLYGIKSIPTVVLIDGDKACTIRGIDKWNVFVESQNNNGR